MSAGIGLRSHTRSAALAASRKSIIFMWSFIPGRRLDARAGIDAPGLGERDGARHVGSIEAPGQDDAMTGVAGQGPIEGLPGAAVESGSGAIEQQGFGGSVIQLGKIEAGCDPGRFPNGERGGIVSGGFVAVELRHVERRDACDAAMRSGALIDEHAYAATPAVAMQGRFGRDVSRALRDKN